MLQLSVVLLVGGESRRMGTDKSEIVIDSCPMWQRQLNLLRSVQPHEIFISSGKIKDWSIPDYCEWVIDIIPGKGPLSGIQSAMIKASGTHLLILGIDMPMMTTSMLQKIIANTDEKMGAVAVYEGFYEPLAAIYPIEAKSYFTHFLNNDNNSLQFIIKHLIRDGFMSEINIHHDERVYFQNANTPEMLNYIIKNHTIRGI